MSIDLNYNTNNYSITQPHSIIFIDLLTNQTLSINGKQKRRKKFTFDCESQLYRGFLE